MFIVTNLDQFHTLKRQAIAVGKFDGVHLGHRKLLNEILKRKQDQVRACVLTFDPLPEVYFGVAGGGTLSTKEEKRRLFDAMGIDVLVELPFNHKTASMDPEKFVKNILCGKLHASAVVAGPDLSFGDQGKGNFALLRSLQDKYGFEAIEIEKEKHNGVPISSTMIRNLVRQGKMEEVAQCLGEPYRILGTVMHGNAIGRKIGIPTINQVPESDKLLPPYGVYYSLVQLDGKEYEGMTNIGVKPTVTSSGAVTVETYIYGYTGNLYGRVLSTSLLTYRRPEQHFSGIDELRSMMEQDLEAGKKYHENRKKNKP